MTLRACLSDLLKRVTPDSDHQHILYFLWRHRERLEWANERDYTPMIHLTDTRATLVYREGTEEGFIYTLSDADEILLTLHYLMQTERPLYLSYTPSPKRLSADEWQQRVNDALDGGDDEALISLVQQWKNEWV